MQKLKITSCAFILCLFGLTLMTVSPAFAVDDDEFTICDNKSEVAEKLSCFREIVRNQRQGMENLSKASRSQEAIVDEAVSKSADLVATLEAQIDDLNIQLTAAESASKAAGAVTANLMRESVAEVAQIADLQSQLTAVKLHQEDVDAVNALHLADIKTLTAERDAMQEQVTKVAATRDAMIADLQSQLAAAQSGSQDAAKAAEKVELLLAFIDKQGRGDTSTIEGQYGSKGLYRTLRGRSTRKNWSRCTDCVISPEEMQALKDRLKD